MSSILILLFSLFLFSSPSSSSRHHHHHNSGDTSPVNPSSSLAAQIRLACNATRYPDQCVSSLSEQGRVPPDPKPIQIIHSAISFSFQNLKTAQSKIKSIVDSSVVIPGIPAFNEPVMTVLPIPSPINTTFFFSNGTITFSS